MKFSTTSIYNNLAEHYASIIRLQNPRMNTLQECDFLENIFRKHNMHPKSIVDLGCGLGRMACELQKRRYSVCAVDSSAQMLSQAKKQCKKVGFVKARIEKNPVRSDVALCWWTTYNYLKPAEFRRFAEQLHKTAKFVVLDSSNYPADKRPELSVRQMYDKSMVILQKREWKMQENKRIIRYSYAITKKNKAQHINYTDASYWYPLSELIEMFNGKFRLLSAYGGYDTSKKYVKNNSERLITVWKAIN